jgi:ubiquinone/menaquinone biosynthesis C-methylase UbiE
MNTRRASVRVYFDKTEVYLRKNPRIATRAILIRKLLGDVVDSDILDIGCGDGSLSLQFLPPDNRVTLVDLSRQMLAKASENTPASHRSRVQFVNSDIDDLDSTRQYQLVLCMGLLAHVASVERTINKIAALISPGGRCVIQITDNGQVLGKFLHWYYATRRALTRYSNYAMNKVARSEVISIAARHGLTLVAHQQYSLLLPGMGWLPYTWLVRYELFTVDTPLLARMGTEAIMVFAKER